MPGTVLGPGNITLIQINTVVALKNYEKMFTTLPYMKKTKCEAVYAGRKCTEMLTALS